MMQSCASAAKLQDGGPILHSGLEAMGYHRVTTTSDRHRQPLAWAAQAVIRPLSRSWHRAQDDALRHLAGRNKTPEGDEKLTRQRHDHRLARAAASIGRTCMEPLGQGAGLLESQEAPCQLDHAVAHPRVAGSGKALLPPTLATLVGRAGEARLARHRPAIAQVA